MFTHTDIFLRSNHFRWALELEMKPRKSDAECWQPWPSWPAVAFLVQCLPGPDCTSDWCSSVLRKKLKKWPIDPIDPIVASSTSFGLWDVGLWDWDSLCLWSAKRSCKAPPGMAKTLQHDSDAQFHTAHGKDRECENQKDAKGCVGVWWCLMGLRENLQETMFFYHQI